MKTLKLYLKKKILIIDGNKCTYIPDMSSVVIEGVIHIIPEDYEFICKGSELTEEISRELVENKTRHKFENKVLTFYNSENLESFISAVESKDKSIDINKCLIFVRND